MCIWATGEAQSKETGIGHIIEKGLGLERKKREKDFSALTKC